MSEDDLNTFESWMRYQAVDPSSLPPEQLTEWHAAFAEISEHPSPQKIGLMNIRSRPGENLYGVGARIRPPRWPDTA